MSGPGKAKPGIEPAPGVAPPPATPGSTAAWVLGFVQRRRAGSLAGDGLAEAVVVAGGGGDLARGFGGGPALAVGDVAVAAGVVVAVAERADRKSVV